ncbi:MAG: hypothetical protein Q9196_003922 [Gyalolechia fulgens]
MSSPSGVSVSPDCISQFNNLKFERTLKYIIYKLSVEHKEIVVEESSTDPEWKNFQNKLIAAKSSHNGKESVGPRYAVYDFQYERGECTRYRSSSSAYVGKQREILRGV